MANDRNKIVNFCAFVALLLAALLILLSALNIFNDNFLGIITFIKDIALLVGIAFAAFGFVRGMKNKKVWLIIYWVSLIVYLVGAFLPLF